MAILKNLPLRLNRDDDVRKLEVYDMSDALNVQTSKSSGRNEGVLENIKGTTQIEYTLPDGINKCIGTITHQQSNNMFFFIWNSNNNHSVYYINDNTGIVKLVVQSSVLNFNKNGFIVGEAYQGRSSEEILLYFTDNINPVRKINVQKALNNTYGTYTDEIISLVKYAPSGEPTWRYTSDSEVVYNNVYNKNYQFRCRYLYDDGEYSAYSAASSLSYNDKQLLASLKDSSDPYNDLNNIVVSVPTGSKIVDKIEVIARRGDNSEWRVIKTLKNTTSQSTLSFDFKDDGSYPVADPIETNKYFDNVPIQAESLAILNSRLFLGNYIDGFDPNPDVAKLNTSDNDITLLARSKNYDIPTLTTFPTSTLYVAGSLNNRPGAVNVYIDFAGVSIQAGNLVVVNNYTSYSIPTLGLFITPTFIQSYEIQNSDSTIADVIEGVIGEFSNTQTLSNGIERSVYRSGRKLVIQYSAPNLITPTINNVANSGFYTPLSAGQSLKKGSKYSLGIIEYDEAGRASTVNTFPNNEVYIPFYSETTPNINDMLGEMSIDARLGENIKPSLRAKKWSWAITENTSVGDFVQYSATGAYAVANADYPTDDTVYISLRGLQSQNSSYITEFDATPITYNYQDGDRLRVISYIDSSGNRVIARGNLDFRITSGRLYGEDDSPIYNGSGTAADIKARTGYILGLQPIPEAGWDASAGSFWNKSGSDTVSPQGAVIFEIYRPKPQTEDTDLVYYEVGGIKNIENAGTATRKFDGGIRTQGESSSYAVSAESAGVSVTIAQPSINFVIGDTVSCKNGLGVEVASGTITDIQPSSGSTIVHILFETEGTGAATIELVDKPAASNIVQGDVWVRPRLIRNDNRTNAVSYIVFPVEDYNVSDFYPSRFWGKGRPNAFSENAGEVRRFSTVTYSETYFNETNVNGLSSFNLALSNFRQYNQSYGAIRRLYANDVYLTCFQENKIGRIPIERRVITTADGGVSLTLSDNILNEIDYYKGDYGLSKAESFAAYDGDFFGWDVKRSKVWELNASGIQLISDIKVSSEIEERSKELLPYYKNSKIPLGVDREFDSVYVSSISDATLEEISDGTNAIQELFPNVVDDGTNLVVVASPEKTSSEFTKNTALKLDLPATSIDVPLSELGETVQNLNLLPEVGVFEYSGNVKTSGTEKVTLKGNFGGTERFIKADYDFAKSELSIPKAQGSFTLSSANQSEYTGFTLGYNKNDNIWTSFYSFIPEMYGNINYSCYSFKDGVLYKHNDSSTYNKFYGVQYNSVIEVNHNQEPSKVKVFDSLSVEGTNQPNAVVLTTNLNSSSIPSNFFNLKEGFYQTMIPRSTSSSSFSNVLGGGTGTFTGTTLSIDGFDAYDVGLQLGDELWQSNALVGTVTAINSASEVVVSSAGSNGFVYFLRPSEIIDGDRLRGYYLTARYTFNDTDFLEVYALNAKATLSKLHNT